MERKVLALFIALIAASSFALFLHQNRSNGGTKDENGILIWDLKKEDIDSFSFASKTLNLTITASQDRLGKYWMGETQTFIPIKDLEDSTHRHGPFDTDIMVIENNAQTQTRRREFLIGATGESFLESLAPMVGKAKIGKGKEIGDEDEDAFGFKNPLGNFSIQSNSQTRHFRLGKKAYGSKTRYIQDEEGQVFAFDARPFDQLLSGDSTFEEKVLFVRRPEDLLSFSILKLAEGEGEVARLFAYKGSEKEGFWTLDEGKKESILSKNWIETKLLRVTSLGALPTILEPKNLRVVLEFEMQIRGRKEKIRGRFLKKESLMRPLYFFQSELSRRMVKVKKKETEEMLEALKKLKS